MALQSIDERHTIWQQFLNKWTLQALVSMTLPQYHIANDASRDNLVNWLEVRTQNLGSIWGGSAFKFGVFNRAERSHKVSGGGLSYTTEYGWYTKYGATPDEAFATVRNLILEIVTAAQKSDIDAIERISFSPAIKWKLAFLYQPQDTPFMPAIYAPIMLKGIMGIAKNLPLSQMYKVLMEQRKGQDILLFTDTLLEKINGTGPRAEPTVRQAGVIDTAIPLNRIFYGPPGTGKTWHTIDAALEILDSDAATLDDRAELKARFDALMQEGRVRFVTFHQSFSYEDFVEGIRPQIMNVEKSEEVNKGESDGRGISYAVKPGIFKEICEAAQARTVYAEDASINFTGRNVWKMSLGNKESEPEPHVLIIDEINRGNIAGIFGELITLIEPSKRLGGADELRVRLPYSRELFGVPKNLYIIGTMNSADRSLTGLDIALRRRFTFKEMCPDPTLLKDKVLQGTNISVGDVLTAMNQRIEVLLDRDHCIGHAPFMSLSDVVTAQDLATVFEGSIVPLLQEYFFEDWGKIRRVLNDHMKEKEFCFVVEKNITAEILEQEERQRPLWEICHKAFARVESYAGIVRPDIKAVGVPALMAKIEHDIDPSCILREHHWGEYHLIQYKDKNSQPAIRIYDGEMLVHRNSSDSNENITDVLRKINSAENLGISTSDEGNTRNFAGLILDKLGIPARS